MKILLCTPVEIKQELGAPRVLLGIAQGLRALGWECRVVGPQEVWEGSGLRPAQGIGYSEALHAYLRSAASEYDVVDYPYDNLPFARDELPKSTLFVARSVILAHHFAAVRIPEVMLRRQRLKRWLTGAKRRERWAFRSLLESARATMENADLVNVANEDDRRVLAEAGIDPAKIVVIPYGLDAEEIHALERVNISRSLAARLCFLGTFDHRKGGADLPRLFAEVHARIPTCQLRLLGTAGLHQTAERVRSFFPRHLRKHVEVVPRFRRDELAGLLEGCTAGVFPSYVEGFGFAVLEMMMAGIPVVAYRSPGPTMMLPDAFLAPRGNVAAMSQCVLGWLADEAARQRDAAICRARAREFTWNVVGLQTDRVYRR